MKNKMKKTIAAIFAALMLTFGGGALMAQVPSAVASAAETLTYGDFEYQIEDDNTVTITKYTGNGGIVSIPSTIDGKSVTAIGDEAFYGCAALTGVTIPSSVTSIGIFAFRECNNLTVITIPSGVTSVDYCAFYSCSNLTGITIPSSVTKIGYSAFRHCEKLSSIQVDSQNQQYSSQDGVLFNKNKTELIQYPHGNSRTTYIIPNGVTNIGGAAFEECSSLINLTIPASVTNIGGYAFYHCNGLTSVTMNGTAPKREEDGSETDLPSSFEGTPPSLCFYVPSRGIGYENNVWEYSKKIYNIANSKATIADQTYTGKALTPTITVKDSDYTLQNGTDYTVSYSNNTNVGTATATITGKGQYTGTLKQTFSITAADALGSTSASSYTDASSNVYDYETNSDGTLTITKMMFHAYNGATINVPSQIDGKTVTGIEWNTDGANWHYNVLIPRTVKKISMVPVLTEDGDADNRVKSISVDASNAYFTSQDGVLYNKNKTKILRCPCGNTDRTSFAIPGGVTEIGDHAFAYCQKMTDVSIPGGMSRIGDDAFEKCAALTGIVIPSSVTDIGDSAFENCINLSGSITIPGSVAGVGDNAFYYCKSLSKVTLQNGVTVIGNNTFGKCSGMTEITLPGSINTIGDQAFQYCEGLTDVTIPGSVTGIGDDVFLYCENLKNVTLSNGATVIGNHMFGACKNLISVNIPGSVKSIGIDAFHNCKNLTEITIPSSVTKLGYYTFRGCTSLSKVTMQGNAPAVLPDEDGIYGVFSNCPSDMKIIVPKHDVGYEENFWAQYKSRFLYDLANSKATIATQYYSGKAVTPEITVKDGTFELKKGEHYKVAFANNTKEGTATATLTGIGNYTGTLKKNFTIIKQTAISNTTATIPKSVYIYTGSAIKPVVTVKDGTTTLKSGTDYTVSYANNTKLGTATITITGEGNYIGTLKKTFAIKKNFALSKATLSAVSYAYTGKVRRPTVTVKYGSTALTKGTDYTVSYKNDINVGTATVTMTGKGNYAGTIKKTYSIVPARPATPSVSNASTGFKVSWKKTAGAGGYEIYRSDNDGKSYTKAKTITSGSTVSFTNSASAANKNGVKYKYKVRAYKTVGGKTYRGTFSPVRTSYKVSRPTISLSAISKGINLTVSKNSKATGYQLNISTTSDFKKKASQNFTKTTWKIKVADKVGKKCYLKVRTYKTVNGTNYYSMWGAVKSITVKA